MAKPLTQITFDFSEPVSADPITELSERVVAVSEKDEPKVGIVNVVPKSITTKQEEIAERVHEPAGISASSKRGRRSLKEIGQKAELIDVPDDEVLFQKQYYSMGDVATMFHENQSLIRYWETEFDVLQPKKNKKGDRFFRPVDVKNLVLIYDLLRRRKFTIEGAKEYLKKNKKAEEKFAMIQSLEKIKSFLLELKASI